MRKIILAIIAVFSLGGFLQQELYAQGDPLDPNFINPTREVADSVSCPVPSGKITTNSYQGNPQAGHCSGSYRFSCNCGVEGRRAKAIDISTGGGDVVLPMIGGRSVNWKLVVYAYSIDGGEGGGYGYTFESRVGNDKWVLDMLHLGLTSLEQGQEYPSGTRVAKSVIDWVHATIGLNVANPYSPGNNITDCDPNWLPSEFMCDPTKQPPTAGVTPGDPNADSSAALTPSSGKSNKVCTKVGNPTALSPCLTGAPPGITAVDAPEVDPSNLKLTINDQFGVDMRGAWGEQALRWVYEKFYRLKQTNPKFMELIRGQPIVLIPNASGANALGNIAKVGQGYAEGEKFLGTLIHEMSHVIYWTKPLSDNLRTSVDGLFRNPGGITSYGVPDITENYPETITYCLTKRPVGSLTSQERWDNYYKPLAEKITGGPCL